MRPYPLRCYHSFTTDTTLSASRFSGKNLNSSILSTTNLEERLPGIPATGIILLPMTQVANWQNFMMYQVNHYLLSSEVEGAPVSTDQHDMSSILSSFNDFEYLMFKEKVRVVVPHENIDALDKLLHRIKPLYDEHAMLFTIDARASQSVRRIENFGTWADQVLYSVQRRADVNGLFWKSLDEVNEDLTVTNIPLQFKRK